MRSDILEIAHFYERPLGQATAPFVAARLGDLWGAARGLKVLGYGFADPYLEPFDGAERILSFAPAGQGVLSGARFPASLVEETHWPLPDASIDRIVIVHGLEEAESPHRVLREAWRVLTDDGRLVIVAAHRRSLWALSEASPYGAGQPFSKGQLERLLGQAMFAPEAWSGALYWPPFGARFFLRAARAWERAGERFWPGLCGVLMVEASKQLYLPTGRTAGVRARPRPALAAPKPPGRWKRVAAPRFRD